MSEPIFFDQIVLGHNAFFGVDHLDTKRGQEREAHFSKPENIIQVIEWAHAAGAGGLMMSTHERAKGVTERLRLHPGLASDLHLYPLLPYVQKYVVAANEKGMINVVMDALSGSSAGEKFRMMWNGAKGVIGKDIQAILANLISIELKPFKGLNMPCVFLHDVFTDLALSLGMKDIIDFYHEEIHRQFGCRAAFATKNLPLFLEKMDAWGYKNSLVMPHFNKIGFSMNPSREECEQVLLKYRPHVMAMSCLASGYLKPDEAFSYLGGLGTIESVVVGMSSKGHVDSTTTAIKKYFGTK